MYRSRCEGLGASLPPLCVHHPPSTSMCSATLKLSKPHSLGLFIEALLHWRDQLSHCQLVIELNLQPFSPPQRLGGGAESSNPLIMWLVPLATSPHSEAVLEPQPPGISSAHNKTLLTCTSRGCKGFRNSAWNQEPRPNTCLLLYHNITVLNKWELLYGYCHHHICHGK